VRTEGSYQPSVPSTQVEPDSLLVRADDSRPSSPALSCWHAEDDGLGEPKDQALSTSKLAKVIEGKEGHEACYDGDAAFLSLNLSSTDSEGAESDMEH
jgi:hypothetical protein